MGNLDAFSIAGMRIWFYSKDHNPPHFHVKRDGEWEYRIYFLEDARKGMFQSKWKNAMSQADKRMIVKMVGKHRSAILDEWEKKVRKS